ncbi:hypothetical protein BB776_05740 [Planococcus salinarum]|uniref:Uncharacterized protein n=1 Tax=Planococcus salinarum TaxID=622695 RepID=A0ABX3D1X2_9BACL|nr:hypothetical protein [Planococcus salinarum]OHX54040.1 hypothetical protein BB776_05740 [Planococcus salinarum]
MKQDRFAAAVALLEQYAAKGDADYFIHSSTMLWDEWPGYTGKGTGGRAAGKGLDKKDLEDYKDMALQYADFGGHLCSATVC